MDAAGQKENQAMRIAAVTISVIVTVCRSLMRDSIILRTEIASVMASCCRGGVTIIGVLLDLCPRFALGGKYVRDHSTISDVYVSGLRLYRRSPTFNYGFWIEVCSKPSRNVWGWKDIHN